MVGGTTTRASLWRKRVKQSGLILLSAAAIVAGGWFDIAPAQAQLMTFPVRPPVQKPAPRPQGEKSPMLLQAIEIHYDYNNKRVSAVGNVQLYQNGTTIEADKVTYDETTKRMQAEGNIRITEPDGRITYADALDLSDDFRDGFVDSLRLDTADKTRMAAARADRTSGTFTVMHSGVYTACEACKDDPKKPPLWQVKAARMIHDFSEKMIYFEDARLEFFGKPVAYMPYFSAPDPTVKRKSGFLMPFVSSSKTNGFGVEIPYYWALAPDYDATFSPRVLTSQGVLMRAEFRQRLIDGAYSIRASGIYQLDKGAYMRSDGTPTPGYRDFRGSIETTGQFALSDKWTWGWDGILPTDPTFIQNYGLSTYQRGTNILVNGLTEGVSQAYLAGRGDRSYFDMRAIYYYGFSEADTQAQIPRIHPVVDYDYVFGQPVLGGELSYRANLTSLSRSSARFQPDLVSGIHQRPLHAHKRRPGCANPRQLSAPRRSGQLHPRLRRDAVEEQLYRFLRPGVHTVCKVAGGRSGDFSDQLSRRGKLPRARRQRRVPRHADGRSRVPLSVHQLCNPGAPTPSSRSRKSSCGPMRPISASC